MPKSLNISKMHESQLQNLTGCRYAVIVHLSKLFKAAMETAVERIGENPGSFDWD